MKPFIKASVQRRVQEAGASMSRCVPKPELGNEPHIAATGFNVHLPPDSFAFPVRYAMIPSFNAWGNGTGIGMQRSFSGLYMSR